MRILVIGGGLFGSCIAFELAKSKYEVDLAEAESDIMQLASRCNHNRIHLGYHYLRSISTAEQSLEGMISFLFYFGEAVLHQFPNYYAIAKEGSHTNTEQFIQFCDKVGIGYDEEFPEDNFLNKEKIAGSFRVPEPVFDYDKIAGIVKNYLSKTGVNVLLNTVCKSLKHDGKVFTAQLNDTTKEYDYVINATYANINNINELLGLPQRKLLFEDVFIPTFNFPSDKFGITVMDGPFCSIMPRGLRTNEFLLYHVKHSVLSDRLSEQRMLLQDKPIEYETIFRESSAFMPFLKDAKPISHWRTIRTVHENSDDARLSELHTYEELPNYFSVLSGKITTCIQTALQIKHHIRGGKTIHKIKI